jgi:hypothetical protein
MEMILETEMKERIAATTITGIIVKASICFLNVNFIHPSLFEDDSWSMSLVLRGESPHPVSGLLAVA